MVLGYTAYQGTRVYQSLDNGRQELAAAQAGISAAERTGDVVRMRAAADQVKAAEQSFADAQQRTRSDPGLRLAASIPGASRQIEASAHLAAIGVDLSRAGEAVAAIAGRVAELKQQYAGRKLAATDLQALLAQAEAISQSYSGSIQTIGSELKAAHAERAEVTTTGLLPQLQHAYDQVDEALSEADTAFLRYQDVRQVLSDLFGVRLS